MRYLSLFSGIEAATVAWKPLGWDCVGVAEIEPFPCAVLAHHYPAVPNLGSVTEITEAQIAALGHIDLVVFGSPCQDLSVAGKRKGLEGERSGLFFTAMRIIGWAREHCGCRFALWENVPGAFSSNQGRDFAAVVEHMAGLALDVPPKGWGTEGCAVGEEGMVEWAVLDAQWFGVAQRRRRVFALADFGDWPNRPQILLEPEGLRGDSAPRREAGQGVAGCLASRTDGGGFPGTDEACSGYMQPVAGRPFVTCMAHGQGRAEVREDSAPTLTCNHEAPIAAYAIQVTAFHHNAQAGQLPSDGRNTNISGPLTCSQGAVVALQDVRDMNKAQSGRGWNDEGVAYTLDTHATQGVATAMQVRRLTPRECERLQGFDSIRELIKITVCLDHQKNCADVALSCLRWQSNASPADAEEYPQPASAAESNSIIRQADHEPLAVVAVHTNSVALLREIRSHGRLIWSANNAGESSAYRLPARSDDIAAALAHRGQELALAIRTGKAESLQSIRLSTQAKSGEGSAPTSGGASAEHASDAEIDAKQERFTTSTLGSLAQTSGSKAATSLCSVLAAISGCIPNETLPERFSLLLDLETPYTLIPVRGKPAADGPRYKALGNSMATPVMNWIGRQIECALALERGVV